MLFSSTLMVSHAARLRVLLLPLVLVATAAGSSLRAAPLDGEWIAATDAARVRRQGEWMEASFRYAAAPHVRTVAEGAALEFEFEGTGVAVRFGPHAVPAYGVLNLGALHVTIDGGATTVLRPLALPNEVTLARGLAPGKHVVRIEHRGDTSPAAASLPKVAAPSRFFLGSTPVNTAPIVEQEEDRENGVQTTADRGSHGKLVPGVGVEPTRLASEDFESTASANSATRAKKQFAKRRSRVGRVHANFCAHFFERSPAHPRLSPRNYPFFLGSS